MHNELVTEVTPTCQLGVVGRNRSVSGEEAAQPSAQRLEDVEKVVRKLEAELEELQVWSLDVIDRLMTRIEVLEQML